MLVLSDTIHWIIVHHFQWIGGENYWKTFMNHLKWLTSIFSCWVKRSPARAKVPRCPSEAFEAIFRVDEGSVIRTTQQKGEEKNERWKEKVKEDNRRRTEPRGADIIKRKVHFTMWMVSFHSQTNKNNTRKMKSKTQIHDCAQFFSFFFGLPTIDHHPAQQWRSTWKTFCLIWWCFGL